MSVLAFTDGVEEGCLLSQFSFEVLESSDLDFLRDRPQVSPSRLVDDDGDPVLNRKHPETFSLEIGEQCAGLNCSLR
jgi:hypothetical protein